MNTKDFSSTSTPNAAQGSEEPEYFLGLEITMPEPFRAFPSLPAGNLMGTFLLRRLLEVALDRENLLHHKTVLAAGELNASAFVASVKNLAAAYRVVLEVLETCPLGFLKPIAVIGYRDTDEMIWRAVWPRTNAPFGQRVDLNAMLVLNAETERVIKAELEEMLRAYPWPSPSAPPDHE